jgi:branched-chain amino acid transport system substrate-binding protein
VPHTSESQNFQARGLCECGRHLRKTRHLTPDGVNSQCPNDCVAAPVTVLASNSLKAALKLNPQIRRVAVMYAQDDAFSKSETAIFQQAIRTQKLETIAIQQFQTTDTDFQVKSTTVINWKPDLIVISGLTADGGNLVRQLRELGYGGLIVSGNGFDTPNLFPLCKRLCDGILVAQAYSPAHENVVNQAFRAAYKQQYKNEPPQFSAQAFTAVQGMVEALQAVDRQSKVTGRSLATARISLNQKILAGQHYTPLGQLAFTPEGKVIQQQFYVAQIRMNAEGTQDEFVFLP